MAQGLTSLHARGIVHRDLKPQNVLITDSGRGKLSDMGLCKRLIPNQSTFVTSGAGGCCAVPRQIARMLSDPMKELLCLMC